MKFFSLFTQWVQQFEKSWNYQRNFLFIIQMQSNAQNMKKHSERKWENESNMVDIFICSFKENSNLFLF